MAATAATASIEQIRSMEIMVDALIATHAVPEWFPEYAHHTIATVIAELETEFVRLDDARNYPKVSDLDIRDVEILTHIDTIQFTNETLLAAAGTGNLPLVRLLFQGFAGNSAAAFTVASAANQAGVVAFLLPRIRSADVINTAFVRACSNGSTDVVRLLLPHVNPAANANYAISIAGEHGHTDVVQLLLEDGRTDPGNAFFLACLYNRVAVVKMMLRYPRVNPAANDNHALAWAAGVLDGKNIEIVRLLLADPRVRAADLWRAYSSASTPAIRALFPKRRGGRFRKTQKRTQKHTQNTRKNTRKNTLKNPQKSKLTFRL